MFSLFVSCPKGIEDLLANEIEQLNISSVKQSVAGVYVENASLRDAYCICLWSRLANRVILNLAVKDINDAQELYEHVKQIDWENHFTCETTIAVDFNGTNRSIKNSQFGAQRVKDAIVDRFRDKTGQRPSVDRSNADIRINVRLHKGQIRVGLDLAGESLHRRGYRLEQGIAPLKENLAAALLIRAGWPQMAQQGCSLLDPMCGSGTLLIEAALIAADIAPGIYRRKFGFQSWSKHVAAEWHSLYENALSRREKGLAKELGEIRGYDRDFSVLDKAQANIERADLQSWVRVIHKNVEDFKKPTHKKILDGLIITNPPYGERLGEIESLKCLYEDLGRVCKQEFANWKLAVFTGNPELAREMRLRPDKKNKFFNGDIASELIQYSLQSAEQSTLREGPAQSEHPHESAEKPLSEGAQMMANRLKKNKRRLQPWLKTLDGDCYRLYDADMPEYSAAIDIYGDHVHIQEYAAPKSINEKAAEQRFDELVRATANALDKDIEDLAIKTRRRNKGKQQYEKLEEVHEDQFFEVNEGKAKFRVNLDAYLDTGLFLDHRPLRQMIHKQALGKSFLNLFCYTASASVQAILGGASRSVSVDMSKTYLNWAALNYELNNISQHKHSLEQADVFTWLKNCRQGFDMIMLDPPSFSNSKRMEGVLDIQRDHARLIDRCMDILLPGGRLYFSNNLRSFKLDENLNEKYDLQDISNDTIDQDFKRNQKIHQCYLIRHK